MCLSVKGPFLTIKPTLAGFSYDQTHAPGLILPVKHMSLPIKHMAFGSI